MLCVIRIAYYGANTLLCSQVIGCCLSLFPSIYKLYLEAERNLRLTATNLVPITHALQLKNKAEGSAQGHKLNSYRNLSLVHFRAVVLNWWVTIPGW